MEKLLILIIMLFITAESINKHEEIFGNKRSWGRGDAIR